MRKIRPERRIAEVPGLHVRPGGSQEAAFGHGRILRTAVVALCTALLTTAGTFAAPPANIEPDPVLQSWFKSLQQPKSGHPCCSVSNCRVMDFWIDDGHYEVEIDG